MKSKIKSHREVSVDFMITYDSKTIIRLSLFNISAKTCCPIGTENVLNSLKASWNIARYLKSWHFPTSESYKLVDWFYYCFSKGARHNFGIRRTQNRGIIRKR